MQCHFGCASSEKNTVPFSLSFFVTMTRSAGSKRGTWSHAALQSVILAVGTSRQNRTGLGFRVLGLLRVRA